jgi:hypothetical protein
MWVLAYLTQKPEVAKPLGASARPWSAGTPAPPAPAGEGSTGVGAEPGDGEWKEFTSREGGFAVRFPGEPEVSSRKDDKGNVIHSFTAVLEYGAIDYTVLYIDFAGEDVAAGDPELVLERVAANLLKLTKSKKDIKIGDHPGIELEVETNQKGVPLAATYRVYLVGGRMYQLMAISLRAKKDPVQTAKFLDSFRLLEPNNANN